MENDGHCRQRTIRRSEGTGKRTLCTTSGRGRLPDHCLRPFFTGESGGEPRYSSSMDINTEDFCAAVDYLSCRDDVDAERIGILGICGWGGIALNAAALDPRIKLR